MRTTHTYAVLTVSPAAYTEIAGKLRDAGYEHAFIHNNSGETHIDMHGIGLALSEEACATSSSSTQPPFLVLTCARRGDSDVDRLTRLHEGRDLEDYYLRSIVEDNGGEWVVVFELAE